MPFSLAQYVTQTAQSDGAARHGCAVVHAVGDIAPYGDTFPFLRRVFNVVSNADVPNPSHIMALTHPVSASRPSAKHS